MRQLLPTVFFLLWGISPANARPVIVVIDPGHGGTNRGALGTTGVFEKHVTLHAARLLKRHLQRPGIQVRLTRTRDVYLTLAERVRRANRARADLFISLHGNASPKRDQTGYEAFVASTGGTARQIQPVSKGPLRWADLKRPTTVTRVEVAAALQDLGRQANRRRSLALGRGVVQSLVRTLGAAHSRGLQQAPFDVLLGLQMPGLLVEMGFMDHPQEGRRLLRAAYLERITEAIARGVVRYVRATLGRRVARSNARLDPAGATGPNRRKDRRRPAPGDAPWKRKRKPVVAFDPTA